MQIKAVLRFDFLFSLAEWLRLTKHLTRKAGEAAGEREPSFTVGGVGNGAALMETSVEHSRKPQNRPAIPPSSTTP